MTKVYLTVGLKFFIERKETPFTVKVCVKVKVTFPLHLKGMLQQIWGVISLKKGRLIAGLPNDIAYIAWIEGGNIYCGDIHHKPWSLQKAQAVISNNTLPTPFGIDISEDEPILHFSKGIDTLF